MKNDNDIPERLPTRCRLPDNWNDLSEEDRVWATLAYYRDHKLQRQELIFIPQCDNRSLLDELHTRALAHGACCPLLVTDLLFPEEMERVWDDYEPAQRELHRLKREPVEFLERCESEAKERHGWARYVIDQESKTANDRLEHRASLLDSNSGRN
jgi:hypothetical protein